MKSRPIYFLISMFLPTGCLPIDNTHSIALAIGSAQISTTDGMVMVYVPEGLFLMGSNDGPDYEKPEHAVWLDAFWIDQTEVSNSQFEKFIKESHYKTDAEIANWSYVLEISSGKWLKVTGANWRNPFGPSSDLDGLENHPVSYMSWNDAFAYCAWAGRRLPSEAEWEKAARGTDNRIYPWGNQKPGNKLLNFADKNLPIGWADNNSDDGYAFTSPIGNYPEGASPYGALDMAGNVWEWVNDWFDPTYYLSQTIWRNPTGPSAKSGRVLRGGSWYDSGNVTRSSFRLGYYPMDGYAYYGFRCAKS